ncbi:MAG: hypothetical protein QW756_00650 [Nitrososphaerota archaeon]
MVTILVKGLSEDLLKELKRLKVELGCKTWAELLAKLVASRELIFVGEEELKAMEAGVQGFLKLREVVSERWAGHPTVLSEFRRSREHETL